MHTPNPFDVAAWTMVVIGLALNLWGAWKTWKSTATRNDHLWPALSQLFKRRLPQSEHRSSATALLTLSGTASGYKSYNSLPSMDDQEAFAKEVNDRLNELFKKVGKASIKAHKETEQVRREVSALRSEVNSSVSGVSREVQSVWERVQAELLSAVRWEVVGSVFVVFGLAANVAKALFTGS